MRVIKASLIIVAILGICFVVWMSSRRSVAPPSVRFVGMTNLYHQDRKDALFSVSNAADLAMRIDFTLEVKAPDRPIYGSTNPYGHYQVSLDPHEVTNLVVRTPLRRYRGAWRLRVENHPAASDLDLRRDQCARSLITRNAWLAQLVSPKRKSQVSFTEELNQ
jgi:hypothetical protein